MEIHLARKPAKIHLAALDAVGEVIQVGLRAFYQGLRGSKVNGFHFFELPAQVSHDTF